MNKFYGRLAETPLSDYMALGPPARPKLRLRHPMECLPFRPEARPKWSPSRLGQRTRNVRDEAANFKNYQPKLLVDKALGAVRINFRYAAFQSISAAHSHKAGRDQYFEGPHEAYGFRLHEIDPNFVDLQYQPLAVEWISSTGKTQRMTLDYGVETQDGRVIFGEDKASQDYFDDPQIAVRLDLVESLLTGLGASLERRVAGGLTSAVQRRCVKDIFDARRTHFDVSAVDRARALITADGGASPLGRVLEVLGAPPVVALEMARAMMHRRLLSMPIMSPPMPDTLVTIPPPAQKGALRAFLARYVEE